MAKNRTIKSCYESHYGGGWVTGPKRLAEMACERIAADTSLGHRFWMNPPWDGIFVRELTHATRLLAVFSMDAIMKAWVSRDGRRVRTLGAPFFKPIVELEQRKLKLEAARLEKSTAPEVVNTLETPRPMKRAGKSIREKLTHNGPTEENGSNE